MSNSVEQRTDEWFTQRLGFCTASKVSSALAKEDSETRKTYLWQLVAERMTQRPQKSGFTSAAMERGVEIEPVARGAYEVHTGNFVDLCGFIPHPTIEWFGASPDGLIGTDGVLEIKCPDTATHLQYIKSGKPPSKYVHQMTAQILCTGRKWADFVSFDDRILDEKKQLFVVRFEPTQDQINKMLEGVQKFLAEVAKECE